MVNEVKPIIDWSNKNYKQKLPFFVVKTGHIFLKAKIDSEEKYLMFDTGMDVTALHEKYNGFNAIDTLNISSSQARKQDIAIHKLKSLSFGTLNLKKLGYGAMSKETWGDCGVFANQDSIAGILGNNVINTFVWDLDMINHQLTIQEKPFMADSISNTKVIPLKRKGMGWIVDVILNGKKKKVKLDSGSSSILNITDSIQLAKTYTYPIVNAGQSKGIFSYLDCTRKEIKVDSSTIKNNQRRKVFANLKIGNAHYKDTYVLDKSKSNLLGIPLFWEYERVVLDFPTKKMYLINSVKKTNHYSISNKSESKLSVTKHQAIVKSGFYEMYYKKPIEIYTISELNQDTIIFNFKKRVKVFASIETDYENKMKHISIDSIIGKGYTRNIKTGDSLNFKKLVLEVKNVFDKEGLMNKL